MLKHIVFTTLLLLLLFSYYPTLLQTVTAIIGSRNFRLSSREIYTRGNISPVAVLLPVKSEPIELIREFLERNYQFLKRCILVCIIAEGYSETEKSLLMRLVEDFPEVRLKIYFQEGSRNKAQALNRALRVLNLSDDTKIIVLDVDSHIASLPEALPVIAAPTWVGYTRTRSMLGLGQVIGYHYYNYVMHGLSLLSGWKPLLGSGLVISLSVLRKLGLFNENVILEDVELSLRAHVSGYSVQTPPDLIVEVQVPSTYSGFLRQQCRWAYGSTQLVRYYLSFLVRRPLILLYLLQYVSYPSHMFLTVLLYVSSLLGLLPPLFTQLALLAATWSLLAVYTYTLCRLTPKSYTLREKLVAVNRVNMAYTIAAPRILISILRGALGLPYTWIPTPKLEQIASIGTRARYLKVEIAQATSLLALTLLCVVCSGVQVYISNPLLLLAVAYTTSAVWGTLRALQRDLT